MRSPWVYHLNSMECGKRHRPELGIATLDLHLHSSVCMQMMPPFTPSMSSPDTRKTKVTWRTVLSISLCCSAQGHQYFLGDALA